MILHVPFVGWWRNGGRFAIYPVRAFDTWTERTWLIWLENYRWRGGRREFLSLNF